MSDYVLIHDVMNQHRNQNAFFLKMLTFAVLNLAVVGPHRFSIFFVCLNSLSEIKLVPCVCFVLYPCECQVTSNLINVRRGLLCSSVIDQSVKTHLLLVSVTFAFMFKLDCHLFIQNLATT